MEMTYRVLSEDDHYFQVYPSLKQDPVLLKNLHGRKAVCRLQPDGTLKIIIEGHSGSLIDVVQ